MHRSVAKISASMPARVRASAHSREEIPEDTPTVHDLARLTVEFLPLADNQHIEIIEAMVVGGLESAVTKAN
ncbi:hypothetical protein ACVIQT_008184 [Bradyrhizobium diazoefficiens]